MSNWIAIGHVKDIPRLGARVVHKNGTDIAVFRIAGDRIYAIEDRCPHKGGPLSQGIVHGERVTCPLHDWAIDLAKGNAVAPDQGCVTTYAVRIAGDKIEINLTKNGQAATSAQ